MLAKTKSSTTWDEAMNELMLLAEADYKNERRSETRYPYFRPVSVYVDNHCFSAFTREVSASGIGLLHSMELPLKKVQIAVSGQRQRLHARIERCDSIGDGWYISGSKIFGIVI